MDWNAFLIKQQYTEPCPAEELPTGLRLETLSVLVCVYAGRCVHCAHRQKDYTCVLAVCTVGYMWCMFVRVHDTSAALTGELLQGGIATVGY